MPFPSTVNIYNHQYNFHNCLILTGPHPHSDYVLQVSMVTSEVFSLGYLVWGPTAFITKCRHQQRLLHQRWILPSLHHRTTTTTTTGHHLRAPPQSTTTEPPPPPPPSPTSGHHHSTTTTTTTTEPHLRAPPQNHHHHHRAPPQGTTSEHRQLVSPNSLPASEIARRQEISSEWAVYRTILIPRIQIIRHKM